MAQANVTKRKLKSAIALAVADNKLNGFNPVDAKTVTWGREPALFWGSGHIAMIRSRSDATIFIGYIETCNPKLDVVPFTPR